MADLSSLLVLEETGQQRFRLKCMTVYQIDFVLMYIVGIVLCYIILDIECVNVPDKL